ncbi:MAG TPA: SusC/RagA family TonB-linked outer membrane protein [Longimicrobiaceae bacterium]|nr:SusC/RagA family TonB-linked outer membrane protein [Longimicrobiaceae bacterium]
MHLLNRLRPALAAVLTLALVGAAALPLAAQSAGTVRGKVVDAGSQQPLSGVQVSVPGTGRGALTNASGDFLIAGVPAGAHTVRAQMIGYKQAERQVTIVAGQAARADFSLAQSAIALDEVVVTALGQTTAQRSLGTAQQSVRGTEVAQAQRENFVNALQGRIAGVEVSSSSGVPGASSQITIRGVSSISGSNQPLFVIDGLPLDNKTMNTSVLASSYGGSTVSFENRGVDFTNRAADINPEDVESIVVLKGPEAAALYGIDAANGAIVITTKRGKSGTGGFEYSNSFRVETTRAQPEIQNVYAPSDPANFNTYYWGLPYEPNTQFYNNVDGFFRTGFTQRHNLTFSGAAPDNKVNYRITGAVTKQDGVVPNTHYDRYNITGAGQSQINDWFTVDLSSQYSYADNNQSFKGAGGPLLGLLAWPQTDPAAEWLTPAGTRRRINEATAGEIDNPYFNVNKNHISTQNSRTILNLGLRFSPFSWGYLKTNLGSDTYNNQSEILRHPESAYAYTNNGLIDVATDNVRNLSAQSVLNINRQKLTESIGVTGLVGNQISDFKSMVFAGWGRDFLEPDFVSVNNASVRTSKTTLAQRRLVGLFGQATFDYNDYLFVTVTGRNDWTSTIPREHNSFFYPGVSSSFVFSDAIPSIGNVMTGKLRAAWAQVGKDARPYAYLPSLETKTTSYGGYGFGFWGPNRNLRPEFANSYEFGTELGFFDDRLGIDATVYRKETDDQIVNDVRGSYGTGFILFNLNGAKTRNEGVELTLRGTPVLTRDFSWDFTANFDRARGTVISLPHELPESYSSDTWLYGNVRNGVQPGKSTRAMTGYFYRRNDNGDLLINPASGLPERHSTFVDAGYDRQPDWTLGLNNSLRYKNASLSFLWDIRKGGDILNATEHYLTVRGLAPRTLDREQPRVIEGVLMDGKENTANPTPNNIVVTPVINSGFWSSVSEELFIEKDINWVRLRDVTLNVRLPEKRFGKTSVFVTGTDLLLFTNYSGLDPIVNGNTAAVGGSGSVGIDYGNFPMPRGLNFGVRTSF